MNNPYNCQKEIFKNWIKRRFMSEIDLQNIPTDLALIWCDALRELSQSLTLPALKRRGFFVQRYDLLAQDFSSTSRGLISQSVACV